jgi:hypothetical protein
VTGENYHDTELHVFDPEISMTYIRQEMDKERVRIRKAVTRSLYMSPKPGMARFNARKVKARSIIDLLSRYKKELDLSTFDKIGLSGNARITGIRSEIFSFKQHDTDLYYSFQRFLNEAVKSWILLGKKLEKDYRLEILSSQYPDRIRPFNLMFDMDERGSLPMVIDRFAVRRNNKTWNRVATIIGKALEEGDMDPVLTGKFIKLSSPNDEKTLLKLEPVKDKKNVNALISKLTRGKEISRDLGMSLWNSKNEKIKDEIRDRMLHVPASTESISFTCDAMTAIIDDHDNRGKPQADKAYIRRMKVRKRKKC